MQRVETLTKFQDRAEDLGESHHRPTVCILPKLASGRSHAIGANTPDYPVGVPPLEFCDQQRTVEIPGRLAGNDTEGLGWCK